MLSDVPLSAIFPNFYWCYAFLCCKRNQENDEDLVKSYLEKQMRDDQEEEKLDEYLE
jgi:hypothetical protein